jgi:hypothetical protein
MIGVVLPHAWWIAGFAAVCLIAGVTLLGLAVRARHMQVWLPAYCFPSERRPEFDVDAPVNIFIAVCDHYEPECQHASRDKARERVARWVNEYPRLFGGFHDVEGRPPQHSFFFPQDEYRPEYLDELAKLCRGGYGDVEIHLHHEHDTAEGLREKLSSFRDDLYHRHGLLRRNSETGAIEYGFIHGNWALCNSHPKGLGCGVDQELTVLMETGCYADFTLPSAPSATQTRTINSIYYAQDIPGRAKSHDTGVRARAGLAPPADHLLMIQGPLGLDWSRRRLGVLPRTENADVHADFPPTWNRFLNWWRIGVHVAGRPDWRFVKLHTHGCKDGNIDTWLGPKVQSFHASLAAFAERHPQFRYHYVTAWEMAQLVHQAEQVNQQPVIGGNSRPRAETRLDSVGVT